MKYQKLFFGIILLSIFSACGNNSTKDLIYKPKGNDSTTVISNSEDTTGLVYPTNTTLIPATSPISSQVITSQQQSVPTTSTGTAGINPEHGKPGHRCDIAVGAPLNSTPQQPATTAITNTPSISPQPNIITTPQPAIGKPIAAGMNPEHGKPGHRCDIAVGAPLDSKPAEVTTVPQQTNEKTDAPVTPLLPATSKPVAAGMNPEHGKPGHRCDIAVGAPLPKQ